MANASAKRIAQQNESTVKTLRLGLVLPTLLSFLLRFLFRRSSSIPPSKGSLALYVATYLPSFFLSNYLIKIGTTKREATTGALISYGEDLSQAGVTEWQLAQSFCGGACQVGSGVFGDWFWWFYMVIPVYAVFKLWTSLLSPLFFGRGSASSEVSEDTQPTSKRQEKLKKRSERGDPRVRAQQVKM